MEPDWDAVISQVRAACAPDPDPRANPPWADPNDPVVLAGNPDSTLFKFCSTSTAGVGEVIRRALEANARVGTSVDADKQLNRLPGWCTTLQTRGHNQGASVSWAHPGAYVVWSAYKKEGARRTEYRACVWVVPLSDKTEVHYLVDERCTEHKSIEKMFFRRQHVVRAVHAAGPVYFDRLHVQGKTFQSEENDEVYPSWIDQGDSMVCQMVDYETAERLAAGDIDAWSAVSTDNRYSRTTTTAAGVVVTRYAMNELARLQKL